MSIIEDKEDGTTESKITERAVKLLEGGSVEGTVLISAADIPHYMPNKVVDKPPKKRPLLPLGRIVKESKFGHSYRELNSNEPQFII